MNKIYEIEENIFGYILTNENKTEKFNLYKSKLQSKIYAPYYLTQILPTKTYLTGMFFDKKQKKFNGKTKEGNKIIITIKNNLAIFQD